MARANGKKKAAGEEGHLREAGSLILLGASLFLFLSLAWNQVTGAVGDLVAAPLKTFLGASAYLLPTLGLVLSGNALRRHSGLSRAQWVAFFGALASGAIFLELARFGSDRSLGGVFGGFLATVLRENFGAVGSYCILVPLFLFSFLVLTSTSLTDAGRRFSEGAAAVGGVLSRIRLPRRAAPAEPGAEKPVRSLRLPGSRENVRRVREEAPPPPPIVISEPPRPDRKVVAKKKPAQESFQFTGKFRLPPFSHLEEPEARRVPIDEESLRASSLILLNKLADFGVQGKVTAVRPGPVITTFEFEPAPGVKVNRIVTLADDLSMALRAMSVRILAPIPGKSVVGIEVSNPRREKVLYREILESDEFQNSHSKLTLALGKDSVGKPVVADLARMPHLLVAGATGTGKSVSLNAMIMSLLFKATPDEVRLLMIDPKMLELSLYENIPHLLTRVVIDPKEASAALSRAVVEMENRYRLLRDKGVRNIDSYNRLLERQSEEKKAGVIELKEPEAEPENGADADWTMGESPRPAPKLEHRRLPYLVIVIDELADLMLTSGREIEEQITRLAQKARAAGIHLILATQRPSVDVITGLIKANFPARISFQVTSRIDSRTILDSIGSERLLGDGDMLYLPPGTARLTRIHGAYVSEEEIRRVTGFLKDQARPMFDEEFTRALDEAHEDKKKGEEDAEDLADDLYDQAVELVAESQQASISWLQRRLRVGYNRAARMIERMEREGLVSPADGVRPREVRMRKGDEL